MQSDAELLLEYLLSLVKKSTARHWDEFDQKERDAIDHAAAAYTVALAREHGCHMLLSELLPKHLKAKGS